jgi:hypothetical protein
VAWGAGGVGVAAQELRIHGVSGTSAGDMLGLSPTVVDDGTPTVGYGPNGVQVFRAPQPTPAHAFTWGGLTSGGWWKALWLLLLPFVLINAAGWAMQPTSADGNGAIDRFRVTVLRVAAVLATALGVQLLAVAVIDVVAWQWLRPRFPPPSWLAFLDRTPLDTAAHPGDILWTRAGILTVLLVFGTLWYLNRVRLPGVDRFGVWGSGTAIPFYDPAIRRRLDAAGDPFWTHAGLIQRLRSIHAIAALGAVTLAAGLMGEGFRWDPPTPLVVAGEPLLLATGAALIAVAVVLVAWRSVASEQEPARFARVTSAAGRAAVAGAVASLVLVTPRDMPPGVPFATLRLAAVVTAVIYAALILGVLLPAEFLARRRARRRPVRASVVAPTLAMLGLAVIGAAGSSAEMLLANWANGGGCLDGSAPCTIRIGEGSFALAVTYAAGLVTLLLTAGLWFLWVRRRAGTLPDGSVNMQVLRLMLTKPATWFGWFLGLAIVGMVAAIALWTRDRGIAASFRFDAATPWIVTVVTWLLPLVAVVWVAALALRRAVRLAALAAIAVIIVAAVTGFSDRFPAVPSSPLQTVLWLGLIGPVTAILLKAWGGIRSDSDRRQLGILWDLGLFWPRWYHPYTPPTYSDTAVREFRRQIRHRIRGDRDRIIVSAHSQGTVIAVAALATMAPQELARIGLVTYGAPVGRLYGELFGPSFDRALLEKVRAGLTDPAGRIRWRNIHRCTDPIGGPIVASHQDWLGAADGWSPIERTAQGSLADLPDPDGHGHSGYQFCEEYRVAVAELSELLATTAGLQQQ